MTDAALLDGRQLYEAQRATSVLPDPLLAEAGIALDRCVVLPALVTGSLPPEVGLLDRVLGMRFDT